MGEDVFTPGTAGDALRSMSNPGGAEVPSGSRQPSTMAQYVNLPNTEAGDFGGVHVNSGIPNKAFYLFATSAGVTKEDAGKVYYRALTTYLTKNAQFVDCRLAVIKSAEDLFGGPGTRRLLPRRRHSMRSGSRRVQARASRRRYLRCRAHRTLRSSTRRPVSSSAGP